MKRYGDYLQLAEQSFETRNDIPHEQQIIVEKCFALQEQIKKDALDRRDSKSAPLVLEEAMRNSLQFSETTINNVLTTYHPEYAINEKKLSESEARGLQFSDPSAPFIGNWTFGALNMVMQEVGSSLKKDNILSAIFPDKTVESYQVILDWYTQNSGIAAEMGGDSAPIPTVKLLDRYGLSYAPGLWGGRAMLAAKDIVFARKGGGTNFSDRGIGQLIAFNTMNIITQIFTRKKRLISEMIYLNGFSYAGTDISSNIPTSNYIAMSSMGTLNTDGTVTYFNSDPLYNPVQSITAIVNNPIFIKYRPYIKGFLVNGADLIAIRNQPNLSNTINSLAMASSTLGKSLSMVINGVMKDVPAYYAPGFDIPFISDDDAWVNQNADGTANEDDQRFFIPRGFIYVLMDFKELTTPIVQGAFHLTYNEVDPNATNESSTMGLFTGIFPRNLYNSDTTNRIDMVAALSGAPAMYSPKTQFIITGLYENVTTPVF